MGEPYLDEHELQALTTLGMGSGTLRPYAVDSLMQKGLASWDGPLELTEAGRKVFKERCRP